MSLRLRLLNLYLKQVEKRLLALSDDPVAQRRRFERQARWLFPMPPATRSLDAVLGGVPALRLRPVAPEGRAALLYLHGGAYLLGSPRTHAALAARLAASLSVEAWLPDYRLAPEHPFPAALEDAVAAYRALLDLGCDRIVLAGDSAGGGLCFALLDRALASGLPRPACVLALSPWTDLALTGDSYRANARRDVLLPAPQIRRCAAEYLAGADPRDPGASPLYGRFAGAPPVLIQVSRAEALLDDSLAMADRLGAQGVDVLVQSWDATPHAWQIFQRRLPEADAAIAALARFGRLHLARAAD